MLLPCFCFHGLAFEVTSYTLKKKVVVISGAYAKLQRKLERKV